MNTAPDILSQTTPTGVRPSKGSARFGIAAFTLFPLTLLILAGFVAVNLPSIQNKARIRQTEQSMRLLETTIKAFHAENTVFPSTLAAMIPAYLASPLATTDAWGRPFVYTPTLAAPSLGMTGTPAFTLCSVGADGVAGTADDLDIRTINRP